MSEQLGVIGICRLCCSPVLGYRVNATVEKLWPRSAGWEVAAVCTGEDCEHNSEGGGCALGSLPPWAAIDKDDLHNPSDEEP